jgi:hypothetical protein
MSRRQIRDRQPSAQGHCRDAAQAWTGYVRGGELVVQFVAVFWNGTENVIQNGTDRDGKQ